MKDIQVDYLDKKGEFCPFCQGTDIEGSSVDVNAGGASQEITCLNCGAFWMDIYTLTGMEVIEEPNNRL